MEKNSSRWEWEKSFSEEHRISRVGKDPWTSSRSALCPQLGLENPKTVEISDSCFLVEELYGMYPWTTTKPSLQGHKNAGEEKFKYNQEFLQGILYEEEWNQYLEEYSISASCDSSYMAIYFSRN